MMLAHTLAATALLAAPTATAALSHRSRTTLDAPGDYGDDFDGVYGAAPRRLIDGVDIANFALQLECLEAEFYSYAAFGVGLTEAQRAGGPPPIGGQMANLTVFGEVRPPRCLLCFLLCFLLRSSCFRR